MVHAQDRDAISAWFAGGVLAAMPIVSFVLQFYLDRDSSGLFLNHLTVAYLDWLFVPFNLLVVHAIDWRCGGRLFCVTAACVIANTTTHALWQYRHEDLGHMISADMVVLPAGWVHLIYSTLQMILLGAFIFVRVAQPRFFRTTTTIAVLFFIGVGACGYAMHQGLVASDVATVLFGLFGVLIYPRLSAAWRQTPNR
jgi:hypothetical protein